MKWFEKLFAAMNTVSQDSSQVHQASGKKAQGGNYQSGYGNQNGSNNVQSIGSRGNYVGSNTGSVVQIISSESGSITVDGVVFKGSKVEQRNGRVLVDGKDVTDQLGEATPDRPLVIAIQGSVGKLEVGSCHQLAVANGVDYLNLGAGTIKIDGNVTGNVQCNAGDITCGNVGGKVKVDVGTIHHR